MIKKLLNKIKNIFTKKEVSNEKVDCPYKLEPKETKVHILKCEHCHEELEGKVSAKDETGAKYIWCRNCNYVNKVKDGKIIKKDDNIAEIKKAFELFKKAGSAPVSYSYSEDGERKKF